MSKEYVTPVDVQSMENTAENARDRLLVHLVFHLGCRISEGLGIAVEDIDFSDAKVLSRCDFMTLATSSL